MIGIIMLDTHFPRIAGDIGNPDSFPFPVIYEYVAQAQVANVVSTQPLSNDVALACTRAAERLQARGATLIGTSCGFLAAVQSRLQAAVSCPVLSSSLLLIPLLRAMYGQNAAIGVLTFDADQIGEHHFNGNYDNDVFIEGLPKTGALYSTIANDAMELDESQALANTVNTARVLLSRAPQTRVFLLECTNLSPYKAELRQQFGLPVFDLVDALTWMHAACTPPSPDTFK